jgi:PIN domain nuclease of toxin-antitoxin system
LYFSSISIWETALLKRKGRIRLDVDEFLNDLLLKTGINLLEPTCTEMIASTLLPDFHKDPFDRLLVSQARQNRLVLVTQDKRISEYDIKSFWI